LGGRESILGGRRTLTLTSGLTTSGSLAQSQPLRGAYGLSQGFSWPNDPSSLGHVSDSTDSVDGTTLRFCTYERPDSQVQPTTSLIRASCFTSSTNLTLYRDVLKVGQINGTLHTCDLQLCEKYYDSITVHSGTKTYAGMKQSNLILQERPVSDNRQHQSAIAASGSNASYDMGWSAMRDMQARFMKAADPTDTSNDDSDWNILHDIIAPTKRNNGTAIVNFPLLFDRFAEVLTSVIQPAGNPDGENVNMDVYDMETYIIVR
jgi:hypothetical protein